MWCRVGGRVLSYDAIFVLVGVVIVLYIIDLKTSKNLQEKVFILIQRLFLVHIQYTKTSNKSKL